MRWVVEEEAGVACLLMVRMWKGNVDSSERSKEREGTSSRRTRRMRKSEGDEATEMAMRG